MAVVIKYGVVSSWRYGNIIYKIPLIKREPTKIKGGENYVQPKSKNGI